MREYFSDFIMIYTDIIINLYFINMDFSDLNF